MVTFLPPRFSPIVNIETADFEVGEHFVARLRSIVCENSVFIAFKRLDNRSWFGKFWESRIRSRQMAFQLMIPYRIGTDSLLEEGQVRVSLSGSDFSVMQVRAAEKAIVRGFLGESARAIRMERSGQ